MTEFILFVIDLFFTAQYFLFSTNNNKTKYLPGALNWDVSELNNPGIYEILDVTNDKSYYGETHNLVYRFNRHREELSNKTHHNVELYQSSLRHPISNFKFIVLHAGPEWIDKEARKKQENLYIERNKHRCYNVLVDKRILVRQFYSIVSLNVSKRVLQQTSKMHVVKFNVESLVGTMHI